MDERTEDRVELLQRALIGVFQSLGNALCVANPTSDDSLGEGQTLLNYPRIGLFVVVNAPCTVRTLGGFRILPGYAVGYYRSAPATRQAPADECDVETLRTISLRAAVQEFASLFTRSVVDAQFDR